MTNVGDEAASAAAKLLGQRRRVVESTCVHCGAPFTGAVTRRTCTPQCRALVAYYRHAEARRARQRERDRARRARLRAERERRHEHATTTAS